MTSFRPVIALSRGLEVLRVINQERQSTVGSLHKATGLNKSTIVRMLETLEHEGYVVRRTEPASYAPTGRALLLSAGYDEPTWIGGIAEPILNKFRKQIHWPSDIAVLDQESMVIAHTTRVDGSLLFSRPPGFRFPVLGTSMGTRLSRLLRARRAGAHCRAACPRSRALERSGAQSRQAHEGAAHDPQSRFRGDGRQLQPQYLRRRSLGAWRSRRASEPAVRQHERDDAPRSGQSGGRHTPLRTFDEESRFRTCGGARGQACRAGFSCRSAMIISHSETIF